MHSLLKKNKVSSILCSPALAVVAAYALRMFLMWLSHYKEGEHSMLPVTGLEEGMVALSLATGKGFSGHFQDTLPPRPGSRPDIPPCGRLPFG